jgi:hypothetical protein
LNFLVIVVVVVVIIIVSNSEAILDVVASGMLNDDVVVIVVLRLSVISFGGDSISANSWGAGGSTRRRHGSFEGTGRSDGLVSLSRGMGMIIVVVVL